MTLRGVREDTVRAAMMGHNPVKSEHLGKVGRNWKSRSATKTEWRMEHLCTHGEPPSAHLGEGSTDWISVPTGPLVHWTTISDWLDKSHPSQRFWRAALPTTLQLLLFPKIAPAKGEITNIYPAWPQPSVNLLSPYSVWSQSPQKKKETKNSAN